MLSPAATGATGLVESIGPLILLRVILGVDEDLLFLSADENVEGRDLNGDTDPTDPFVLALLDGSEATRLYFATFSIFMVHQVIDPKTGDAEAQVAQDELVINDHPSKAGFIHTTNFGFPPQPSLLVKHDNQGVKFDKDIEDKLTEESFLPPEGRKPTVKALFGAFTTNQTGGRIPVAGIHGRIRGVARTQINTQGDGIDVESHLDGALFLALEKNILEDAQEAEQIEDLGTIASGGVTFIFKPITKMLKRLVKIAVQDFLGHREITPSSSFGIEASVQSLDTPAIDKRVKPEAAISKVDQKVLANTVRKTMRVPFGRFDITQDIQITGGDGPLQTTNRFAINTLTHGKTLIRRKAERGDVLPTAWAYVTRAGAPNVDESLFILSYSAFLNIRYEKLK